MTATEKEIEKYISDVNSHLLCSSKKKKEIIEDIRSAVLDFVENSGTENITDIYKHFGTPEELAKAHLIELDPKQIKKKVNIRKVVIIVAIIVLFVFAVAMSTIILDAHDTNHGYFIESKPLNVYLNNIYSVFSQYNF